MNKYLQIVAQNNNLKTGNDYIYGEINGYMFTVRLISNATMMNVNTSSNLTAEQTSSLYTFLNQHSKQYGLIKQQISITANNIAMNFKLKFTKNSKTYFPEFTSLLTNYLHQIGIPGCEVCSACHMQKDEPLTDVALGHTILTYVTRMHASCAAGVAEEINTSYDTRNDESNLSSGIVGALLGAFVGSIAWILIFMLGYVTSFGGIIIGLASNFGYKKLKGPQGRIQIVIIAFCVIIAIIFAQYACEVIDVYRLLSAEGYDMRLSDVRLIAGLINQELAINDEYSSQFIKNIFLGLFYGAIGVFFVLMRLSRENRKVNVQTLD